VPESLTGMELLDNFRASDVHMAFVIDEYGEVQGIVTLQDLIEAITGEFHPHDPETSWAVQRDDGSWLLDGHPAARTQGPARAARGARRGQGPLPHAERHDDAAARPPAESRRHPPTGRDWRFEIVDMDGKRIDKVLASRIAPSPDENPPSPGEL
jgi:putative hemolysin